MVDKGLLDFDERISTYWPEFAQGNKSHVTLRCLLGHRAGVTFLNQPPTFKQIADLDQLAHILASQPHNFNGNVVQGYHAVTRGWYLNEIIRRVDPKKRTIGQIVRQDFMPLLNTEFYLGLPNHLENRVSKLIGYPTLRVVAKVLTPSSMQNDPLPSGFQKAVFDKQSTSFKAVRGSQPRIIAPWPYSHNRRAMWEIEAPSFAGITNSRSLATFAALMANNGSFNGTRIISSETIERAKMELPWMQDTVFTRNITFNQGGWGVGFAFPGSEHVKWIGWGGVGGSMVWWNPERNISFSYVMNSVSLSGIGDRRSWRLVSALINSFEKSIAGRSFD